MFVIATGLYASREITAKLVVGNAEASMVTALELGHRFAILSPSHRLKPVLQNLVHLYILTVNMSIAQAGSQSEAVYSAFYIAGRQAIDRYQAEVLILGQAFLAGMETKLSAELGLPVLDPVKCAVAQGEALVRL